MITLLSWRCHELEGWEIEEELFDKSGTAIGTKFSVLHRVGIPFEKWDVVLDRWSIHKHSVFIARLSMRQYCWRVIEDFQNQEYIQFIDVNCDLFMRLHFSIGGYDFRRTILGRHSINFSIIPVLFADHMHRRSGVDNKFSFLRFKSWCREAPIFRRWEECCSLVLL